VTNVPGASAVLLAGVVSYSNAAKQKFLGVQADTLLFVSVSPAGIVELYEIDLTTVHLGS